LVRRGNACLLCRARDRTGQARLRSPFIHRAYGNDNSDQYECRVPGDKSDRNDAVGIAPIMQTGWFKEVCVKDLDCPRI
jgi:hypothetical protein